MIDWSPDNAKVLKMIEQLESGLQDMKALKVPWSEVNKGMA